METIIILLKSIGRFQKIYILDDKIAGLYICYFNRAPDWDGFNYWKSRGYSDSEALNILLI